MARSDGMHDVIRRYEENNRQEAYVRRIEDELITLRQIVEDQRERYETMKRDIKSKQRELDLLRGQLVRYKAVNHLWTGTQNLYPFAAVRSYIEPHITCVRNACTSIYRLCTAALGVLNNGGGRLGGSGGGGGSGRQNSKIDRLLASVTAARDGIERLDTHMDRFEALDLPLQSMYVRNMYGAHQATITHARANPPIMPHEYVCKLLNLLFMCRRQRLSPPQLQNVPDCGFDGFEFCNIGTRAGNETAECTFRNYDTAVRLLFSRSSTQQPHGILSILFAATADRYAVLRMLVPVLEQLWTLSKQDTSLTFEEHTTKLLLAAAETDTVGGKRKRRTVPVTVCVKTIKRSHTQQIHSIHNSPHCSAQYISTHPYIH